ncbi:Kelch-like protein 21 [Varanus komodoensis]|nr:Kelch-like protein 21 [Varanus komodoensis]
MEGPPFATGLLAEYRNLALEDKCHGAEWGWALWPHGECSSNWERSAPARLPQTPSQWHLLLSSHRDDSAEVDVYSPAKNEWDKIPPMLQVHVGGSLAVLGGKLYVSGGYDNTFELSGMVESYDPETRKWSVAGQLPEPIFWHSSVSIFRQFMPETLEDEEEERLPLDNALSLNLQHNQNLNELR